MVTIVQLHPAFSSQGYVLTHTGYLQCKMVGMMTIVITTDLSSMYFQCRIRRFPLKPDWRKIAGHTLRLFRLLLFNTHWGWVGALLLFSNWIILKRFNHLKGRKMVLPWFRTTLRWFDQFEINYWFKIMFKVGRRPCLGSGTQCAYKRYHLPGTWISS